MFLFCRICFQCQITHLQLFLILREDQTITQFFQKFFQNNNSARNICWSVFYHIFLVLLISENFLDILTKKKLSLLSIAHNFSTQHLSLKCCNFTSLLVLIAWSRWTYVVHPSRTSQQDVGINSLTSAAAIFIIFVSKLKNREK